MTKKIEARKKIGIICKKENFEKESKKYKIYVDSGLYEVVWLPLEPTGYGGLEITHCSIDEATFIDRQLGRRIKQAVQNEKRTARRLGLGEYATKKPREYNFDRETRQRS